MKKKGKIILAVLLILFLAIGGFLFAERDNIAAFLQGRNLSAAELEQSLAENRDRIAEVAKKFSVRDLTEEEKQALRDGTMTAEELQEKLAGMDDEVARLIARLYLLREKYTMMLEALESDAQAELTILSNEGKKKSELIGFARTYITKANTMERECDSELDEIVDELKKLEKDGKTDESVRDMVIETYTTEKSLKKAYYVSKMKERGLI